MFDVVGDVHWWSGSNPKVLLQERPSSSGRMGLETSHSTGGTGASALVEVVLSAPNVL